jgi:hypothetical protein
VEQTNDKAGPAVSCPDCHALVSDLPAHKQWHSRLVKHLALAVEDEIKRLSSAAG